MAEIPMMISRVPLGETKWSTEALGKVPRAFFRKTMVLTSSTLLQYTATLHLSPKVI